jgi:hypothetical protein
VTAHAIRGPGSGEITSSPDAPDLPLNPDAPAALVRRLPDAG